MNVCVCCMDDPSYPCIKVALVFSYVSFSPLSLLSPSSLLLSHSPLLAVSEDADKVLELALKYRPRGVVGVDIAGNELLPLDPIQTQALLAARAHGLHLTMHAGESGPPDNVRQVGAIPAVCPLVYSGTPL